MRRLKLHIIFKIAYYINEGKITKTEYSYIQSVFQARIGIKGVNKVVQVGENEYEIYLNSLIPSAIVGIGGAAVGLVLSKIRGLSSVLNTAGCILTRRGRYGNNRGSVRYI